MTKEFKREDRYIVIKRKDLKDVAPLKLVEAFEHMLGLIQVQLPSREYVVVESGWPEYEATRAAIERRVTGSVHWDGKGLPPIGATCETQIVDSWAVCSVIAHHALEGRPCAVWVTPDGKRSGIWDAPGFRPIRTPEQIEAEERKKAIKELRDLLADNDGQVRYAVAAEIYKAGYRKQVTQ